jgi:hypothetical protein
MPPGPMLAEPGGPGGIALPEPCMPPGPMLAEPGGPGGIALPEPCMPPGPALAEPAGPAGAALPEPGMPGAALPAPATIPGGGPPGVAPGEAEGDDDESLPPQPDIAANQRPRPARRRACRIAVTRFEWRCLQGGRGRWAGS